MHKISVIGLVMLGVIFLSACANSNHVARQANNQFVTEFYAWVENVETIKFKSYVNENAAMNTVGGTVLR